MPNRTLWTAGGRAGMGSVFRYALDGFVAAGHQSAANRPGLLFAAAGFTMVLGMIVVQPAVNAGFSEAGTGLALRRRRGLGIGLFVLVLAARLAVLGRRATT